jgi:hypothetical protein
MSDLEQLTEVLAEEAHAAPSAVGLATAARSRARQRRRTRLVEAAAAAAVLVGVPTAVAVSHDDGGSRSNDGQAADDPQPDLGVLPGYRAESWQGVTLEVPDTWGYGAMSQWCVGGGSLDTPLVDRPGGAQTLVLCTPGSSYGVSFGPAEGHDVQWPVAAQHSDSWPDGTYVGATTVKDVVVTVAAPDAAVTATVLGSVRAIGPEGDPNGCAATVGLDPPALPSAMSVCRYDAEGALGQSELLTAEDVNKAVSALRGAPDAADDCQGLGSEASPIVLMRTAELTARVELGGDCPVVTGLDRPRSLTMDVLYWALSPGWSGAVVGDIPLPKELRQR